MTKDSIFYIGTMEKAKNLLCWIKSSSLSGEIMKNYRFLSFVWGKKSISCPFYFGPVTY